MADPAAAVARTLRDAGYAVGAAERSEDAGVIWAWKEPSRNALP